MADKNITQGTSFQELVLILCANSCRFFNTPATNSLCSKCFRKLLMKQESGTEAKVAFDKFAAGTEVGKTPFAFGWTFESISAVDNAPFILRRASVERQLDVMAIPACAIGVEMKVSSSAVTNAPSVPAER